MKHLPIKIEPAPNWEEEPVQLANGDWIARGLVHLGWNEDGPHSNGEYEESQLTPPTSNYRPMHIENVGWYWIPFEVQLRVPEFVSEIRFYTRNGGYFVVGYCAMTAEDVEIEMEMLKSLWQSAYEQGDKQVTKGIESFILGWTNSNNATDDLKSNFYDGVFPRLKAREGDRSVMGEWPKFHATKAVES